MKACETIWVHMSLFEVNWNHLKSFETISNYGQSLESIWNTCEIVWNHLNLFPKQRIVEGSSISCFKNRHVHNKTRNRCHRIPRLPSSVSRLPSPVFHLPSPLSHVLSGVPPPSAVSCPPPNKYANGQIRHRYLRISPRTGENSSEMPKLTNGTSFSHPPL